MIEQPQDNSYRLSEDEANELMRSLLHKEGSWVEWGQLCQKLQKAGYDSQIIFERTGFQTVQQNLIIVAAQVYQSIVQAGASKEMLSYFQGPRSDVLYEFRILNQEQRAAAADLAFTKKLDVDDAREVAKAVKDLSRLSQLPAGFSNNPGDALAYQCWKLARQKKDLQQRSRLIAKGLKYAYSLTAKEQVEKLLSDFTVVPQRSAPLIPVYRLGLEDELARIVPVVGTLPLSAKDLAAVASVEIQEPFRSISISGNGTFVPLPGWQAVLKARDPVAILCPSDRLPKQLSTQSETVLILIDRSIHEWDVNSYFVVEQQGTLELQWFEESPQLDLLGQVILVLRPKKILDENNLTESWQMDD